MTRRKLQSPLAGSCSTPEKKSKTVFGDDIVKSYKKSPDVIKYLLELHEELKVLNQDLETAPQGFTDTARFLLSPQLLDSSDKKVRLLVSCCLVDVFRVYAPDAPYKDFDMIHVFESIINQIRGLQTVAKGSEDEKMIMYILESLSTVKSCVIPVIMAQKRVHGAMEIIEALFESLINSVRPDHSETGGHSFSFFFTSF
jgi:sister-chromatid-cohesion protein PDS5